MNAPHQQRRTYPIITSVAVPPGIEPSPGLSIMVVTPTEDGVRRTDPRTPLGDTPCSGSDLVEALRLRGRTTGVVEYLTDNTSVSLASCPGEVDAFATTALVLPRSDRWRQAVATALLGDWCDPLFRAGLLPHTALGALKAEAQTLHRQLVPLWRRRTRHGRMLSLDADLGGLSLYDLVAADADLLTGTTGGLFEDERLNCVLRGLHPAERRAVFAYAEGEGTTWSEAAAVAGATDPEAFGERVRRKARRLAVEQARRMSQRQSQE